MNKNAQHKINFINTSLLTLCFLLNSLFICTSISQNRSMTFSPLAIPSASDSVDFESISLVSISSSTSLPHFELYKNTDSDFADSVSNSLILMRMLSKIS